MVTIRVFLVLCLIATAAADYRNLCAGDSCEASCDGDDCNYCSGSTCCETSNCNQCVNRCSSSNRCRSSGCYNNCLDSCAAPQQCSGCNSCATRSCSRRCQSNGCDRTPPVVVVGGGGSGGGGSDSRNTSYKHDGKLDSKLDNNVDIITNVTLENKIENINNISIPIHLNSTNINTITVKQPPAAPPKEVEVITIVKEKEKMKKEKQNCCVVIPPKQCHYENENLQCQQTPYKSCSSVCNSPVVVPHPVPVPVYLPRPYPVPQPYPVIQTVDRPVPVPHPVHVPVPHPVPQPVPVPMPVPVQQQQICPMTYYGNNYVPVCNNVQQAQQFMGSSRSFLMDSQYSSQAIRPQCSFINQHPWFNCNNMNVEGCASCLHCQGAYNPSNCMQSPYCSNSCRHVLQQVHFPTTIGQNCRVANGQFTCV